MNLLRFFSAIIGVCFFWRVELLAQEPIEVKKSAAVPIIPIFITGYSGEADRVLKFDLEIAGFRVVDEQNAHYVLSGSNDGSKVEGRLVDKIGNKNIFGKAFTGGNTRTQAHSLSDEVVSSIFKVPGIARTKIGYKLEKADGNSDIYISDYDGHNPVPVTQDNSIVAAPAWVPGHWHLFYTSYKSGYPYIYSHNLSSGERRAFSKFPGLNTSAAISPDGKRVAMILSKAGSPDLWVCNIDGTGLTQLTKTPEDESSPCWSPDGRTICFASRVSERRGLYLIPSTGGSMRRLATDGVGSPTEPSWSPDGKKIIFTTQFRSGFNLCIVPAEGGTAEVLVEGEDPSWAPNSRTVVFTKRVGGKRILSLLDVPTKRVKDTAQISGSRSQPSWAN